MKRRAFLQSIISIFAVPFVPVLKGKNANKYIFSNIEVEGCEIIFCLEGITYELEDGKTYELSSKVVNHINSLKVFGRHRFLLTLNKEVNDRRGQEKTHTGQQVSQGSIP